MDKQRTIERTLSIEGAGLHTGHKVKVTLLPAEADSGVAFVRTDLPGRPVIKASSANALSNEVSPRRSGIGYQDAQVHTVEHLMAALSGLKIDNIIVEISSDELPALDGSARNFTELIKQAGVREQDRERRSFALKEPVTIEEEGASITAVPSAEFKITYTLDYKHPLLKTEFIELNITQEAFEKELSGARTFCLEEEAARLQKEGIGLGANYENTLVVGKNGVIRNKLRFEDEFVRHKVLDLVGDLYLAGCPVKAHIIAVRSGHSLNVKLAKKIAQQKEKYMIGTSLDVNEIMKILPHREPFLFVDRITHLEMGKRATGIKNVTINDYFFKGHFPGKPVMPGVLIVEAMAQVGGVMMLSPQENRGKLAFFMAINNVKFRKPVVPGDQLVFELEAVKIKSKTGQVRGRALVDGKVVAEADLMFALAEY